MKVTVSNYSELKECLNNLKDNTEIVLGEGVFEIDKPININCDGITITGQGEKTVLTGTRRINIENLEKVDGMVKINLCENGVNDEIKFPGGPYEDYWREYDIPKPHLTEQGPPIQLFFDEKELNWGRYPENNAYLNIKKSLGETDMFFKENERNGSREGIFVPSDTFPFDNDDPYNFLLIGCWNHDWAMQRHVIESYDKETKAVKVTEPYHTFGYRDGRNYVSGDGGFFYIYNTKLGVKKPGDWYIDLKENTVYLIPYENQTYVEISMGGNIIEAYGRSNIKLSSMTMRYAKKTAVEFMDCKSCVIENLNVHNTAAWGIIADKCYDTVIKDCNVSYTAGGGISCSGGDRATLTSSGNRVERNDIHHTAYWHKMCMAGIELNGVNVVVSENKIHDVPNSAIMYQGNNHIIEKNYIYRACCESNDAGAMYAGRDYTCQGTVIRYNILNDLNGLDGKGCVGIYFDDGMCTAEVYGNILSNMSYVGILIGGGRNFDVHDNHFYNCKIAVMFDDRLDRWTSGNKALVKHLDDVPYRSEIWKNAYPYLYNILEDEPTLPKYNKFYDNIVIGGDGVAMTYEKIEKYMEHYGNTYVETTKTPYIWHLTKWHYLTDKL